MGSVTYNAKVSNFSCPTSWITSISLLLLLLSGQESKSVKPWVTRDVCVWVMANDSTWYVTCHRYYLRKALPRSLSRVQRVYPSVMICWLSHLTIASGVSFSLSRCDNIFLKTVNAEWGGNNFIVGGLMLQLQNGG